MGGKPTFVALAVSAHLIGLQFQKALDGLLVLECPIGSRICRPSRHGGLFCFGNVE